jgi:hypothetical protein
MKTLIVKLKSFPDHKGIPGHQGGSLPKDETKVSFHDGMKQTEIQKIVSERTEKTGIYHTFYHAAGMWKVLPTNRLPDMKVVKPDDSKVLEVEKFVNENSTGRFSVLTHQKIADDLNIPIKDIVSACMWLLKNTRNYVPEVGRTGYAIAIRKKS